MKEKTAFGVLAAAFLATASLFVLKPMGDSFFIVADLLVASYAFVAFVFGVRAYRLHGFRNLQGKALLFLSLGLFFWFLAESAWLVYEGVLGISSPGASAADILWFAGYPLFFIGICLERRIAGALERNKRLLAMLAIVLAFCALYALVAVPVFLDAETTWIEKTVSLGYVMMDILLLTGGLAVIISFGDSRMARQWVAITSAIILFSIADIAYAYLGASYETGNWIDLLWDFDYLLMAYGFFYYRHSVQGELSKGLRRKR